MPGLLDCQTVYDHIWKEFDWYAYPAYMRFEEAMVRFDYCIRCWERREHVYPPSPNTRLTY